MAIKTHVLEIFPERGFFIFPMAPIHRLVLGGITKVIRTTDHPCAKAPLHFFFDLLDLKGFSYYGTSADNKKIIAVQGTYFFVLPKPPLFGL